MVAIEGYASELKKALKYNKKKKIELRVSALSWPMLLHRLTGYALMTAAFLVTCDMLFGKPIHCLHNAVMPSVGLEAFINTYCWFNATYIIDDAQMSKVYAHPGVAPMSNSKTSKFIFYQWIALLLFLQGLLIGLPVKLWAECAANRLKELMATMPERSIAPVNLDVAAKKKNDDVDIDHNINNEEFVRREEERVNSLVVEPVARAFLQELPYAFCYTWRYLVTEIVCILNLLFQLWLLNIVFESKYFDFVIDYVRTSGDPKTLNLFPRVTKCVFPFFSAGGSVQIADALCILPMNIINEKIYLILALWIAVLTLLSTTHLLALVSVGFSAFVRRQLLKVTAFKSSRSDNAFLADQLSFSAWFLFTHLLSMLPARNERNIFVALLTQRLDRRTGRRYGVFRAPQIRSTSVMHVNGSRHEDGPESLRMRSTTEEPQWVLQRHSRKTPV